MDQQKNKGQQSDSRSDQPRRNESQTPRPDDSETARHDYRNQGRQETHTKDGREKGRGSQGERNLGGGISNRGIDREMEEQEELPDREPRQSER